jgi:HD-GYP domain-containing protein (c-di-GMP phosphodiesterase class II)
VGADETHFWARICSVADVFDALTCRRPYRNAISARQACEYLEKHAGAWFDPEVVAAWTRHVRGQP